MKALILAGGKGLELLPMTTHLPKPVVMVGNIPFVFYQLDILKKAGIKEAILSLSYQPRKIMDLLGDGSNLGMVIRYTTESVPLGTAGAVKNAAHLIDQTLVVLNGDILTAIDLKKVIEKHYQKKALLTMVYGKSPQPERFGMILHDRQRKVISFIEKPRDHELLDDHVNVGAYIFEREILDSIPPQQYYTMERELFPSMIARGASIYAYKTNEYWLDIGDPGSYLQANYDVISGRIQLPGFYGLFQRKAIRQSPSARLDDKSLIDESCLLKAGVSIENSVVGQNCRLEERVHIKDSVILAGTRVKKGADIRNSVIGKSCVIGEYVSIQRGSYLGDKSYIADYSRL